MNVIKLFLVPGEQKHRRQTGMKILFHSRNGNINESSAFYKRKKLFVKVAFIPAEIVVAVRADNGVKKLLFKRQLAGVGLDGNKLFF